MDVGLVVTAFWAMLPAYVPNNAAVLAGGGRPIDGGRMWGDRRLLGDGKTWRGTAVGTLVGVALAAGLNFVAAPAGGALGVSLPMFPPAAAVGLAAGAMGGDIAASFLKRRSGRARGAAFPGLDQLDFAVGAVAVSPRGGRNRPSLSACWPWCSSLHRCYTSVPTSSPTCLARKTSRGSSPP